MAAAAAGSTMAGGGGGGRTATETATGTATIGTDDVDGTAGAVVDGANDVECDVTGGKPDAVDAAAVLPNTAKGRNGATGFAAVAGDATVDV